MDPLTIALQAAPLIYQGIVGKKRGEADMDRSQQTIDTARAAEQEALGRRSYGVGDAWNQYLAASKQDKTADLQRQIASEQEASTIGALKSGGAKALLGGLGAAQRQSAQQRMGIEAQSQARQQAALQQYAGVQQRVSDANVGLASMDVQRQQQLQDTERDYLDKAREDKRAGIDSLVNTGIGLASQLFGVSTAAPPAKYGMKFNEGGDIFKDLRESGKKDRESIREGYSGRQRRTHLRQSRDDQRKEKHAMLKNFNPDAYERRLQRSDAALEAGSEILRKMQTGRNEEPFTYNRESGEMLQEDQKFTLEEFLRMSQGLGGGTGGGQGTGGSREFGGGSASNIEPVKDANGNPVENAQGQTQYRDKVTGETMFFKAGGVHKTPGEFSHAKNPIDIMKDGAKIGEMTGGEYIFNPRQASTLQSLASKGGSPLHKYVRNLLKEFDRR